MKNYLYYPNMEPPTSEWLKFSVLYLDKLESIVPYSRRELVSDEYKQLRDETDLVEFFSPTYNQGVNATTDAMAEAGRMLKMAYNSAHYFNTVNLKRDWKNPDNWDYQVYNEKFSFPWKEFCEREQIGRVNDEGIVLPKSLAFLYMTHLAKRIARDENLDIITDDLDYDRYVNYSLIKTINTNKRDHFIRSIIKLQAPQDIRSIPLKNLIEFRKRNRDLITAFNNKIDEAEDSIGKGVSEQKFIDDFNYTLKNMTEAVVGMAKEVVVVPLGLYALLQSSQPIIPDYVKLTLESIGGIVAGVCGVRKALQNTQGKRMCKRYLADLRRLR